MHLIIFIVFGISIAIFDDLDNEMFAGLFWGFLILGTLGAFIQATVFRMISNHLNGNKWRSFIWIFLVELTLINLAYISQGSKPMTWLLISERFASKSFIVKGAVAMHIGVLISSLMMTFIIPKSKLEKKQRLL